MNLLSFAQARPLINEGDILLFKGVGIVSKFIKIYGEGEYSHVGLASWVKNGLHGDILECIEIREWKGGRSVNLERYAKKHNCKIDVYRPIPSFHSYKFDMKTKKPTFIQKEFHGRSVTHTFRKLLGIEYGWRRIWWIFKRKIPLVRMFCSSHCLEQATSVDDIIYPICSSAVAYSFLKNNFELVHNRPYDYMEPCDIARSTRLSYLFTICDDTDKRGWISNLLKIPKISLTKPAVSV